VSIVAVVGPTAAGKSVAAVAIARSLAGEVVNADAMQLYRGMDIGTAKLTARERGGVPHHLLDVWDVTHDASVAEYQTLGRSAVDRLTAEGRVAVLAGGSGLYVRAVIDRLEFPGTDADVRSRLEAELVEIGAPALHERLSDVDPLSADAILPSNGRRIVRALEVVEITGRPFSSAPGLAGVPPHYDGATLIGIAPPLDELDARIGQRVEEMWSRGLVGEVVRLVGAGLRDGRTASRALGYAQVLDFLDGRLGESESRQAIVTATRRFARRQLRWWRGDPRVQWVASPEEATQLVVGTLGG
jgi:tRNA dimethylallyltransferase